VAGGRGDGRVPADDTSREIGRAAQVTLTATADGGPT
jgi:hypothetical protein